MRDQFPTEQILGIRFFNGRPGDAVSLTSRSGGLLVAPSGTCFQRLLEDDDYRRAIASADIALPDSGLMVTLWRLLRGRSINRISGLAYLKALLAHCTPKEIAEIFWVLPNERSRAKLISWFQSRGEEAPVAARYVAPMYGRMVADEKLLALIEARHPRHVVIGLGAGAQEKLGWYLREHLSFRPAIHCIGGALGFVTGDQVAIPDWADRLYLGWLLRLVTRPRIFLPRLWKGRVLPGLIRRYGEDMPPRKKIR